MPRQQNGAGGRQNSHRQEAHVSPFHLHTGRQAFPGHCSRGLPRGLPRLLSAHRPSGAGAGLAPATLPGPAFVCSLPAACGPAHALPADTGKKIPWCKNKHGSPTCFYTRGSPVCSLCSPQCWGLRTLALGKEALLNSYTLLGSGMWPPQAPRGKSCPKIS